MNLPFVSVTLPVYNEEHSLAEGVLKLLNCLAGQDGLRFELAIANNGSTDRTQSVAEDLAMKYSNVRVFHVLEKGRGGALRTVWSDSSADVLSYMDVDLSTDLEAFPRLIEPLLRGEYDVATGSRLLSGSRTTRCWKREQISRSYNRLVKAVFHTRFSDAQCGFKAITKKAANRLLPLVEDDVWFFDTELLVLAERLGYRILDLPVRWVEDSDSRVRILSTAIADIKGLMRLRRELKRKCCRGQ